MFTWKPNAKLLYCEFSTLYPIAGFSLIYDRKKGKWVFSGNTKRVTVEIGTLLFDDRNNVLIPECYTYEFLEKELYDDESILKEQIGFHHFTTIENTNFEDNTSKSLKLSELDDQSPIITLYLNQMDNRFVKVKTKTSFNKDKLATLACHSVLLTDMTCHYLFFQDWLKEKTCVLWGYREDYSDVPPNEDQQRKDLIYNLKHLLTAYQFRIAMPSEDIEKVDSNTQEIVIGSKQWYELLARAYPRPWWVAAWSPKEKRLSDKYITFYRELALSLYKYKDGLIPKPLRTLNVPHYDLSEYIKDWNVDTSSTENAIKSVWKEFHDRFTIDYKEPQKTFDQAFKDMKVHPYDAADIIAEILRQVDKIYGSNWAGGGIPVKPCVLDPLAHKARAAVKTYVLEKDQWVLSEIGKQFGDYDPFERKIERLLIRH